MHEREIIQARNYEFFQVKSLSGIEKGLVSLIAQASEPILKETARERYADLVLHNIIANLNLVNTIHSTDLKYFANRAPREFEAMDAEIEVLRLLIKKNTKEKVSGITKFYRKYIKDSNYARIVPSQHSIDSSLMLLSIGEEKLGKDIQPIVERRVADKPNARIKSKFYFNTEFYGNWASARHQLMSDCKDTPFDEYPQDILWFYGLTNFLIEQRISGLQLPQGDTKKKKDWYRNLMLDPLDPWLFEAPRPLVKASLLRRYMKLAMPLNEGVSSLLENMILYNLH